MKDIVRPEHLKMASRQNDSDTDLTSTPRTSWLAKNALSAQIANLCAEICGPTLSKTAVCGLIQHFSRISLLAFLGGNVSVSFFPQGLCVVESFHKTLAYFFCHCPLLLHFYRTRVRSLASLVTNSLTD